MQSIVGAYVWRCRVGLAWSCTASRDPGCWKSAQQQGSSVCQRRVVTQRQLFRGEYTKMGHWQQPMVAGGLMHPQRTQEHQPGSAHCESSSSGVGSGSSSDRQGPSAATTPLASCAGALASTLRARLYAARRCSDDTAATSSFTSTSCPARSFAGINFLYVYNNIRSQNDIQDGV